MKRRIRTSLMALMLTLALVPFTKADQARNLSFRVENGDTFTNLFGSDWQKAYEQNKLVVFRDGKPVTSPDLLIEGMIVRVSSDVGLTPRAVERCGELRARREQVAARLTALEPKVADNAAARAALTQARRLVDNDLHFAADVDFAARQIEYVEALARQSAIPFGNAGPVPEGGTNRSLYLAIGFLVAVTLSSTVYFVRLRPRPRYPEADARYREVIADLKASLSSARQNL